MLVMHNFLFKIKIFNFWGLFCPCKFLLVHLILPKKKKFPQDSSINFILNYGKWVEKSFAYIHEENVHEIEFVFLLIPSSYSNAMVQRL